MGYLVAIPAYVLLTAWSLINVSRKLRSGIDFVDGISIGLIYFLAIPLGVTLATGSLEDSSLRAPAFHPLQDDLTTFNIMLGWGSINWFHSFWNRARAHYTPASGLVTKRVGRMSLLLAWIIAVALSGAVFFLSGKSEGGHWQERMATSFQGSTTFILVANFANAFRTMIFGALAAGATLNYISKRTAVVAALAFALLDLVVSFNRITLAYWAIMVIVLYYRHIVLITTSALVLAPMVSFLSGFWAIFRGIALRDGIGLSQLSQAAATAAQYASAQNASIARTLNAFFEASNIQVFNYVVLSVPDAIPPLKGATFIGRTVGILIPSTIWASKPVSFNVTLGERIAGVRGLALNSTLFGEAYGNFYFLWIPALILYIFIFAKLFEALATKSPIVKTMGAFAAIALWRFDVSFAAICLIATAAFQLGQGFLMARTRSTRGEQLA